MAKSKVDYWLTEDGLTLLKGWARDGLTDEQIAHNCGLKNRKTLYDWKKKYSNISNALKKGKEIVDIEVENALLKRALGYTQIIKENKVDRNGYEHELEREVHIPGDVTAMIFWLKNRKKDQWREKEKEESLSNDNDDGVVIINDLPKYEKENN